MNIDPGVLALVFAVLFGVSEALGQIKSVKENNLFQVIMSILSVLSGKAPKA